MEGSPKYSRGSSRVPNPQPRSLAVPQPMVTINVSDEKFYVHVDLICFYSSYFKGTFDTMLREGKDLILAMAEFSIPIFGIFVHWLYHMNLQPVHADGTVHPLSLTDLVKLYQLSLHCSVPHLSNAVNTQLLGMQFSTVTEEDMKTAVNGAYNGKWKDEPNDLFLGFQANLITKMSAHAEDFPNIVQAWIEWFPPRMLQQCARYQTARANAAIKRLRQVTHGI